MLEDYLSVSWYSVFLSVGRRVVRLFLTTLFLCGFWRKNAANLLFLSYISRFSDINVVFLRELVFIFAVLKPKWRIIIDNERQFYYIFIGKSREKWNYFKIFQQFSHNSQNSLSFPNFYYSWTIKFEAEKQEKKKIWVIGRVINFVS